MNEELVMAAGNPSARVPIYQTGTGNGGNFNQSLTSNRKIPDLTVVPRPTAHPLEYDTYEGRLATYYDWPSDVPVTPEDLSRAGFYYTHYVDKVKCPYCYGGIYNWEPTDYVFSEHVRHNPNCEFMKYKVYEALSTPVPVISSLVTMPTSVAKQQPFEEQPAVKAVRFMGYSMDIIRQVVHNDDEGQPKDTLNSDIILDRIFELERKVGKSLADYNSPTESSEELQYVEGAVGELNLKNESENNGERYPSSGYGSLEDRNSLEPMATGNNHHNNTPLTKNVPSPNATNTSSSHEDFTKSTNDQNVSKSASTHEIVDQSTSVNVSNSANSTPKAGDSAPQFDDPEYQRLKAEHRALKSSAMCSGCRVRGVDCLFLPCRHLVACEECAERMEDCPQCQAEIIGTVKVFLT